MKKLFALIGLLLLVALLMAQNTVLRDFSCQDAGANDTYACSLPAAPSGYVTGQRYLFKANTANTGAATVNFNSLGAITIKKVAGGVTTDLADNDIRAGQWVGLIYDGTNMQMTSALGNIFLTTAVTSIATTSPITGGTITTTGTIACGTCGVTGTGLGQFASTSSSTLAGVISDETGSGLLVFATSPSLATPTLGVASATTINKITLTTPATGSTLTIIDGKTLTATNTMDVSKTAGVAGGFIWADTTTSLSSTAAGAAKQLVLSGGTGTPTFLTYPDVSYSPAADCVNAIAGSAWSTGATPAALCRAGTNNKSAELSPWGASDVGYIQFHIAADTDLTTALPQLLLELTSTDATNGHTVIMQESVACAKEDGTTTDDVAFNAARSLATVTLNGNANRTWKTTLALNSTDMTGCTAPGLMWVKISRTTDTATNVGIMGLNLTQFRLLTTGAN